jgi:toxin YoeB
MEIKYLPDAGDDLAYWIKTNNKTIIKKISDIIRDIIKSPYKGLGKPEPLKFQFSGLWSRRITKEHRLIYEISHNTIIIHSMRGHYQ